MIKVQRNKDKALSVNFILLFMAPFLVEAAEPMTTGQAVCGWLQSVSPHQEKGNSGLELKLYGVKMFSTSKEGLGTEFPLKSTKGKWILSYAHDFGNSSNVPSVPALIVASSLNVAQLDPSWVVCFEMDTSYWDTGLPWRVAVSPDFDRAKKLILNPRSGKQLSSAPKAPDADQRVSLVGTKGDMGSESMQSAQIGGLPVMTTTPK